MKTILQTTALSKFTGIVALFAMLATDAIAANVHFKREPVFVDAGQTLNSTISLVGLGNQDVTITLQVTGSATYTLINPGGNAAPGQNKIPVSSSTSVTISSSQIKNGNLTVSLESPAPAAPVPTDVGAPNNNWTTQITDVSFSTATITVVQGGRTVLKQTFDLEP
jgi:hypothetical protein